MYYKEVNADVFKYYESGYHLAHCISADFKLGAGIAKEIDKRYDVREDLLYALGDRWYKIYDDMLPGFCLFHEKKRIIDLVTKTKYNDKPTLYSMRRALEKMRAYCIHDNVTRVAMPRIGCGLDKLKWSDVSAIIKDVFKDVDIEIIVCYI